MGTYLHTMKRVLIFLAIIISGCFVIDRIGGVCLQEIHERSNSITAYKYRYLFNNCNEQLVLLGTSRCEAHYDPRIIEDTLQISVYNGGVDASDNIYSHYAALCLLLQHHTPKYILLDLMPNDVCVTDNPFITLSYLAPYIGREEHVDSLFRLSGTYWYYQLSHLYRYNSKALSDIGGMFMDYDKSNISGFIAKEHPVKYPDYYETDDKDYVLDTCKIAYLDKFHKICKENGIKLFFAISPILCKKSLSKCLFIKKWAEEHEISIMDYHNSYSISHKNEYFYDNYHLNVTGTQIYSKIIASELKSLIEK